MSSPKKKLPTGPVRINVPITHQVETNATQTPAPTTAHNPESESESNEQELKKQDSSKLEAKINESSMFHSSKQEVSIIEATKLDSSSQDSRFLEGTSKDSALEETSINLASQLGTNDLGLTESGLTETEYKKVAMRLSSEAVESLRQLRATTGIPYEILVDVMIRNWDKLPQRTRAAYLQQAQQVRVLRLIAGQEKTMKTMRTKYLSQ